MWCPCDAWLSIRDYFHRVCVCVCDAPRSRARSGNGARGDSISVLIGRLLERLYTLYQHQHDFSSPEPEHHSETQSDSHGYYGEERVLSALLGVLLFSVVNQQLLLSCWWVTSALAFQLTLDFYIFCVSTEDMRHFSYFIKLIIISLNF